MKELQQQPSLDGQHVWSKVRYAIAEFILLALVVSIVPLTIYLDIQVLSDRLGESSLTEMTQAACLFVVTLLHAYTAWRDPVQRGFRILVSGFFLTMLIREHDYLFDLISHGWWKYPALAVTATSILLATRFRRGLFEAMAAFTQQRGYQPLMIGLVVVLVFSRIFGTGNLWQLVMQEDYLNLYKAMIQEGLELFGYLLILVGSLSLVDWQAPLMDMAGSDSKRAASERLRPSHSRPIHGHSALHLVSSTQKKRPPLRRCAPNASGKR